MAKTNERDFLTTVRFALIHQPPAEAPCRHIERLNFPDWQHHPVQLENDAFPPDDSDFMEEKMGLGNDACAGLQNYESKATGQQ